MDEIIYIPLQPKYMWLTMSMNKINKRVKNRFINQALQDKEVTSLGVSYSIIQKITKDFIAIDMLDELCSKLQLNKDFVEMILKYNKTI